MNYKEYQKQCKRTCPDLGGDKMNLPHMILGMVSEIPELGEAVGKQDLINAGEELADFQWYFANYCTFRGYDFSLFEKAKTEENDLMVLFIRTSQLTDLVKKNMAYSKDIDKKEEMNLLINIQGIIINAYTTFNINLQDSLDKNIAKLKVRFPDKFSEENAINRNLEEERKELE